MLPQLLGGGAKDKHLCPTCDLISMTLLAILCELSLVLVLTIL